jgi:aminoglycoside phosphotransferase (APT) family kinase protein
MSAELAIIEPASRTELIARTLFDSVVEPRLRVQASRVWRRWRNRSALARTERLIAVILPTLPAQPGAPAPVSWKVQHLDWTEGDVVVALVGPPGGAGVIVLKLPHTAVGVTGLRRQFGVLSQLHANEALGEWRTLLPRPILEAELAGQPYFAESAVPGRDMGGCLSQPSVRRAAYDTAMSAIRVLHRLTASSIVVDEAVLRRWVDEPVQTLRGLVRSQEAVNRLVDQLHADLAGQTVQVGWIHGDFWPRNLLVDESRTALTGIVDWDLAEPGELPMHDVLNLLLATPQIVQGRGLGDMVRAYLNGAPWLTDRQAVLDEARCSMPATISERTMLLLYWLRFIVTYLRNCPDRARDERWMHANVERVLATVGSST